MSHNAFKVVQLRDYITAPKESRSLLVFVVSLGSYTGKFFTFLHLMVFEALFLFQFQYLKSEVN